jgi:hypothetical protein
VERRKPVFAPLAMVLKQAGAVPPAPAQFNKSFLVLFFKKEHSFSDLVLRTSNG